MLTAHAVHEAAALARLPQAVHQYYVAGSGDEVSLGEAQRAWAAHRLRPRVLRDVSVVDTSLSLLGADLDTPVIPAPMAFHGLLDPSGECATVEGAAAAGALTIISTRASRRLSDIGAAARGPWWFQVYVMRDHALTRGLVERAVEAGASALVLTVDTPYVGRKRSVVGTRLAVPDDHFLVNLPAGTDRVDCEQDPSLTPDVIGWLARVSGLPVLVKGVLRGDEALRCVEAGAAGVVVSNHGGRQLDRAVPSALALPEVVEALGGRVPVVVDGGLRDGGDVLVALALGADAVLQGRPVAWGLAADGAAGVAESLRATTDDLSTTMALVGAAKLDELTPDLVVRPR